MILRFGFEYLSTSLFLEKLLLRELKQSTLKGELERDGDMLFLYVEGNEKELEEFANELSLKVPLSLYLQETKVEVVDMMPVGKYDIPDYPKREFPPCPKCLQEALESFDPFIECEACGYSIKKSKLRYRNFAKVIEDDNEVIFSSLAKVLLNGAIVKIKTFSGYKSIALLNEKNYKLFRDDFDLLGVDMQSLNELFSLRKGEILSLGSIEKPILSLKTSLELLEMFPFIDSKRELRVRLADDLLLDLLLSEVKKSGGKYLILSDTILKKESYVELDFDSSVCACKALEAVVLEDGKSIVTKGDRSLIPKVNKGFGNTSLKALSNDFVAVNCDNKITTYRKIDDSFQTKSSFVLEGNGLRYEAAHGAFYSVIAENRAFDKVLVGVYFSKTNSDKIMINSPKFGLVDYIKFKYDFPSTIEELFSIISSKNKTSAKLVSNFRAKFSNIFDKELKFAKMGDIYELWGVIGVILGLDTDGDVKKSAKKLLEHSLSFKGKKGPRIDYKLKRYEDKPTLDTLKVIQTSMSFALAGIDLPTLSFGIIESFAEFSSNMIDEITKDYDIDGVSFNGSLFEAPNLINKFYAITKKNYKIFFNKEFILDDMNLGYGIINAACAK